MIDSTCTWSVNTDRSYVQRGFAVLQINEIRLFLVILCEVISSQQWLCLIRMRDKKVFRSVFSMYGYV